MNKVLEMNSRHKWLAWVILCLALFGNVFWTNYEVSATGSIDSLYKRAYANNLSQCYQKDTLKDNVSINTTDGVSTAFDPKKSIFIPSTDGGKATATYLTFLGHVNLVESSLQQTCNDLFFRNDPALYLHSIFKEFNKPLPPNVVNGAGEWLKNIGYAPKNPTKTRVAKYTVTYKEPGKVGQAEGTDYVKFPEQTYIQGKNFVIQDYDLSNIGKRLNGNLEPQLDASNNAMNETGFRLVFKLKPDGGGNRLPGQPEQETDYCYIDLPDKFDDIKDDTRSCGSLELKGYILEEEEEAKLQNEYGFAGNDIKTAYGNAREYFTGERDLKSFSEYDVIDIYKDYLNDFHVSLNDGEGACQKEEPDKIYDKENEKFYIYNGENYCTISIDKNATSAFYGGFERPSVGKVGNWLYPDKILNFENLIEDLVFFAKRNPEKAKDISKKIEEMNKKDDQNATPDQCYDSAGPMGWILCPAIVATSGVGNYMWSQIENYLQVKPGEATGEPVQKAWGAMRDIANIIFTILFLFVIFSQLTGVGIDNYGVKKILPKLIVIAILINLSFLLCQLAVDISNITGAGIRNLLTTVTVEKVAENPTGNDTSMVIGGATGLAIAGVAVAAIFTFFNGLGGVKQMLGAIAIGILGAIIVVVVAVLVMYLILTVRQAAIILLIVLSPVAIVCYALPNTEKLFKKWADVFKALLVVYPICGAMIGAGLFAQAILVNANPLMAMIIAVVPYFFVPVLLRNSLNALGNLGGRISTIGRNFGRRSSGAATGAIRNNDRYKDWQQNNRNQIIERNSKRRMTGLDRVKARRGSLSPGQTAAYARAQKRLAAVEDQREKDYKTVLDREDTPTMVSEFGRGLSGDDAALAGAAFESAMSAGGEEDILQTIYDGDFNNYSTEVQERMLKKFGSSNNQLLKDFSKYRNAGGTGNFKQWLDGDPAGLDVANKSFVSQMQERGDGAMASMSTDTLKFLNNGKNRNGWSKNLGNDYARMAAYGAINNSDAKSKTQYEEMMKGYLSQSGNSASAFKLNENDLGSMRNETLTAINDGYIAQLGSATAARNRFDSEYGNTVRGALADRQIAGRMNSDVSTRLNNMVGGGIL